MKKQVFVYILMSILMVLFINSVSAEKKQESSNMSKIRVFNVEKNDFQEVDLIQKTEEEWKEVLTKEQFHVTRQHGTERPFSHNFLKNKAKGVYKCACCGTDLFLSETKFDSGTGWPSFFQPVKEENIGTQTDGTFFMKRTEVHCPRCKCHLGHVFNDGPKPTGLRYCINGEALTFKPLKK